MKYKIVYNDELRHFGVKGMKWGEWNEETKARYLGIRKRKNSSKSSNANKTRRTNNPKKMSDEELKHRTERLQREAEYRKLKNQAEPGKAFVNDVLQQVGKKVIVSASAGAILYSLQTVLGNQFDLGALGRAVFNGGPKKSK